MKNLNPILIILQVFSDDPIVTKIADFGLARVKANNQTMTKCGTKAWIAPEVEVLRCFAYNENRRFLPQQLIRKMIRFLKG